MSRLLRDPLLHFLLAGVALFALYGLVGDGGSERPDRIVVSEQRVAMLAETFARTWLRPPTEAELRGLVDDHVIEEILYREALALGLDRDDLVVRRRMRQKMEFLSADLAGSEPTEEELAGFLRDHPERFARQARLSFEQVFVNAERSPGAPERAAELLARLRVDGVGDLAPLGDATLLPRRLEDATAREVADAFGGDFATALADAPVGSWHGPIASSFGLHLVRVGARVPARVPALDEVREQVEREVEAEQRHELQARFERALRERYEVVLPDAFAVPAAPDARE